MSTSLSGFRGGMVRSREIRRAMVDEQLVGFRTASRIQTIGRVAHVALTTVGMLVETEAALARQVPTADAHLARVVGVASMAVAQRLADLAYD